MQDNIRKLAQYWSTSQVFDEKTRAEIAGLLSSNNEKELTERFYRDLEFGTGGMRGILGAGSARMNIYNVRKASQAFADELNAFFKGPEEKRVAISYDSRHFSRDFAEATAGVMAANGIRAYITRELRPTPMLSFMVRHYQCKGGVCVTASHNPPEYNGYKVYWETGGQIVPPHDEAVIRRYAALTDYESIRFMSFAEGVKKGLIHEVGAEFDEIYFKEVDKLSVRKEGREGFKIVYSPLHGTGAYPVTEALKRWGFKDVMVVPEQAKPDGNFPTVKYPNPEEPEAMKMAIDLGRKVKADLVLGTDPDTDRIGIVVREGDEYRVFNGNQIGSLLVDFYLSGLKDAGRMPANPLVIKTIVTTDQQDDIARFYGATCEETLTGFKWICQLVDDIEKGRSKPYRQYVCGGEESYGFLAGTFVRDKDAVSACCIAAEMVAYYKAQGKTLSMVLDELYLRHGVYLESLATLTLPGKEGADRIRQMMEHLRSDPPREIAGSEVRILRDVDAQTETSFDKGKATTKPYDLPRSNVLQFVLADGSKVSARPSGTEPKIKFYFSVHESLSKTASPAELSSAKGRCAKRLTELEAAFNAMARS
ncbi:phospho-sugar mutase [Oligoflexus tunisiensis]|uniref:phospho-sugar mutase n=1 Tax=Oligoflexus tunisiensis TaxID=708132 RepID=UPI00159F02DA|nr:phospho-sugar mutase [Oligoflexus tunisiensis]